MTVPDKTFVLNCYWKPMSHDKNRKQSFLNMPSPNMPSVSVKLFFLSLHHIKTHKTPKDITKIV